MDRLDVQFIYLAPFALWACLFGVVIIGDPDLYLLRADEHFLTTVYTGLFVSVLTMIGYWGAWRNVRKMAVFAVVVLTLALCKYIFIRNNVAVNPTITTTHIIQGAGLFLICASPIMIVAGYLGQSFDWDRMVNGGKFILGIITVGLLIVSPRQGIFMAIFAVVAYVLFRQASVTKHRPDLLSDKNALQTTTALLSNHNQGVWCGEMQGRDLYASIEDRGVVIGPPGTGKTTFLISQLLEWSKTRRPFVCLDTKPEIHRITKAALESRGYKVIVYNPTSNTGQRYNPLADLDSSEAIGELASGLIPNQDERNAVFNESARDFLDAIITHFKATGTPTLPQIWTLIGECETYEELLKMLSNSEDADARTLANALSSISSNERLMGSVYAVFRARIRFLRFPNIRQSLEQGDFSLAELTTEQPVALFLQFEEKHRETTGKLLSALIGHILLYLITHHEGRQPVFLMLDEIGTVPPINGLVQKLNTIRSRNIPTMMYWQSTEQMQPYGEKHNQGPNTILSACDLQMVFRLNDNATAEWMSKRIGTVDRLVDSTSVTHGDSLISNVNHSKQLVKEPIIFPHELAKLDNNEVVGVYGKATWRGKATPYYERYPEYKR